MGAEKGKGKEREMEEIRELRLLEELEQEPEARQVDLAARLGVAVGTVNWLIKRLAAKGYVKVKRIGRWRWRYLLTPQGVAAKARLTQQYLQYSMRLYRETRQRAGELLDELRKRGYSEVCLEGDPDNDLLDVCRLTCLERGVNIIKNGSDRQTQIPRLRVAGREVQIEWPKSEDTKEAS